MNWDEYYMKFAELAATKSKDSTKVGAILVDPDGAVILTAFNGPPRGVEDRPDRLERPRKYLFASHGESNLISFAARRGITTKNCKVYCTHISCASCTRTLIQAGITELVYGDGTFQSIQEEAEAVKEMFAEAGLILRPYQESSPKLPTSLLAKRSVKEYTAFAAMRARCLQTMPSWKLRYGETVYDGIELEEKWKTPEGYQDFYDHLGPAPEGTLLDRINNKRGYVKGNLRWATSSESNSNKRNANLLTAFGKTQNLAHWAVEAGLSSSCLRQRIYKHGWSIEKAVSTPKRGS